MRASSKKETGPLPGMPSDPRAFVGYAEMAGFDIRNGQPTLLRSRTHVSADRATTQIGKRPGKARTRLLTLPEQIAEQLAQDIVSQTLVPGQRLKEMELSRQFDASRAPIREALRLLELRGLVQIESRRGVSVTQLSAAEVDDLYEIRASLLGLAARRVALTRSEQFLSAAKALMQRLRQYATIPLYGKYFEATYELSNLIGQAAGSPRLFSLIASFSEQVARYTRLSLQGPDRRKQSLRNWERLVRAIDARDPETAERVQKELVFGSRDRVREIVAQQLRLPNKSAV
jgi:DNA-binding GntR family transcriptional regulator